MFNVQINKGTYRGQAISGAFIGTRTWFPDEVPAHETHLGDGKVFVQIDGKERGVWVFKSDIEMEGVQAPVVVQIKSETPEEMDIRIKKRFRVMDMMTVGIIKGSIRALIISGAPGIGKTYTLDKELKKAHDNNIINYKSINGKISGIGLYERLYNSREKGSVLLIDDVDVFSDMDILNLLKAALDSGETRKVCWSTASAYLEDKDIPKEFDFCGTVVFITNVDIDAELERNTKLTPHLKALVSRSVYLDLGVHSNEEIMTRVRHVVMTTNMLQKRGMTNTQVHEALNWLTTNVKSLRDVSIRQAIYLADFTITDQDNWEEMAEATMLK